MYFFHEDNFPFAKHTGQIPENQAIARQGNFWQPTMDFGDDFRSYNCPSSPAQQQGVAMDRGSDDLMGPASEHRPGPLQGMAVDRGSDGLMGQQMNKSLAHCKCVESKDQGGERS